MTQDNKIWHKPDEKLPEDGCSIVVLGPMGYGTFVWETTEHRAGRYHYENWHKWAYVVDILVSLESSSKALDVAIDALKDIQWFCYAPTMGERARYMQQCADKTLKQISEIMKGGK